MRKEVSNIINAEHENDFSILALACSIVGVNMIPAAPGQPGEISSI